MSMTGGKGGFGGGSSPVAGLISTTTGIAVLPNTGDDNLLKIVAIVSIVIGAAIVLTSVARLVAKKAYKA